MALAKIKEERQAERNAHEKGGEDWKPEKRHRQASAFGRDKDKKDDRGNDDVETKECADAGREQFLAKHRQVQAVIDDPGNEFPVGQDKTEETERKVDVAETHTFQCLKK
jgi:hypothetical protein